MAVMGFSALVSYAVSRHLFRVAAETDSPALLADAIREIAQAHDVRQPTSDAKSGAATRPRDADKAWPPTATPETMR